MAIAVLAIWVGASSGPVLGQEWSIRTLTLPGGVETIFKDRDRLIVQTRTDVFFEIQERGGQVAAERLGSYRRVPPERRPDMLPDGVVVRSPGSIREAYLIGPTSRYRHGVLGDSIEALGLRVMTSDGATLEINAGQDAVFEDLMPRLVDVTGDGMDEIIVVRSFAAAGASTVVLTVDDGTLRELATAEPIGRSNRWLNPIGVADFDGDGRLEIAIVRTPHIGGILILYEVEGEDLVEEHRARGFSNHFIGSRDLGLSLVSDFNDDGVADMAIPSADRSAVRVVSFANGRFTELVSLPLPARVRTNLLSVSGQGRSFVFGLADGRLATVRRD